MSRTSGFVTFVVAFSVLFSHFLAAEASPHVFHTSLTLIEQNTADKTLEITMQLFTRDLSKVLEARHNKRIDLEKTDTDKLIFNYLLENFALRDTSDLPLKIKWVGRELERDKIYIYLEIPFEGILPGKKIRNSVFFETFDEQTNLVVCKFDQKKADLLFLVGDQFKEIHVSDK